MSPTSPCCSTAALQERRPNTGVVDSLAELADEQLGDRLRAPVAQEVRQLEERVDTGRDDDVQVDLLVDPPDAPYVAAEAGGRRIDDRPDPGSPQRAQLLHRVRDPHLLVPVARAPHVAVVLERLRLHHEDVLVRERRPEVARRDRTQDGLDGFYGRSVGISDRTTLLSAFLPCTHA